jgi:hypothetical protein
MFGKTINTKADVKKTDPLVAMKAAIDKAIADAERAGVLRAIYAIISKGASIFTDAVRCMQLTWQIAHALSRLPQLL